MTKYRHKNRDANQFAGQYTGALELDRKREGGDWYHDRRRARVRPSGRRREWPLIKRSITTLSFVSIPVGGVLGHSVCAAFEDRTESRLRLSLSHPLAFPPLSGIFNSTELSHRNRAASPVILRCSNNSTSEEILQFVFS